MTSVRNHSTSAVFRWLMGFALLAAVAGVASAAPFSEATDQAHRAVERELRSRVRSRISIHFSGDREERLSDNDRRVLGGGYFTEDDTRARTNFTFSVRVDLSSSRTRDLSLSYDRRDIERRPDSYRFDVFEPRGGDRLNGPNVRFSGTGDGRQVRVDVYQGSDRKGGAYFTIRDGRWEGSIRLREGDYRGVARVVGSDRDVVFRFSVRGDGRGRDPSGYGRELRILLPRERDEVRDGTVEISGVSDTDEVRVRLYDKDDRRIMDRTVRVRGGRWSVAMRLRYGGYHADVDAPGYRVTRTVHFRVR